MSRLSDPGFESATGAPAKVYAQIKEAVGSVPNAFTAALKTSLRRKLLGWVALAILAGGVLAMVGVQSAAARQLPMQSIVNGQRLQPRDDELRAIHHPDVTASQAAEIDRLYRELLHRSSGTLASAPEFELVTSTGIASVSIRESPPGMTQAEFERIVAQGMESAMPGSLVQTPVVAPFPTRRIAWRVSPVSTRGVVRLVVSGFDGPDAFVYEQQVVDNSAPTVVLESAIASMTSRLTAALDQQDSRAPA